MKDGDKAAAGRATGPYRVLARKYRPSNFSELIGQEPMVRTLTNAFKTGRIAQAWMLTGVRGVGKTTTARILARALNYRTSGTDEPSVDLAELGEHCQSIMEGRHVDVIEMDAASHTGIDDIRDIIERVRYAPVSARYKVYIIDEVHMLSPQAFNGLLKTLEEPPPHVKFIFATTEIRKVPVTILSRCQRFDLRRLDAARLMDHLQGIAKLEGISVENGALAMIARAAEGSVRDALSILDQAIAHGGQRVLAEEVRAMLGLADRSRTIDLFETLMKGDVADALAAFRSQYDAGADPAAILTDLAEFTNLVTRLKFVPSASQDASLTEDEKRRGALGADSLSVPVLSRTWQMLLKGIAEVENSGRPVGAAEMVLVRIAHAADLPTLDEALAHFEARRMGRAGNETPPTRPSPAEHPPRAPVKSGPAVRVLDPAPHAPEQDLQVSPEPQQGPAVTSLADIAALAEANRDLAFKVLLKRCIRLVRVEPGRLEVNLTEDAPRTLLGDLTSRLQQWTGTRWLVTLSRNGGGPTLAESETSKLEGAISDARADPSVAAILAQFPGARIIDVRIPEGNDLASGNVTSEQAASEDEDN